ncbi:hypothetical protein Poli38472_014067 [Pythium oligandrum]|uniref:SPX domain-containing protein n=1 Tax=Pythium oligandrum TaxID=41045 RepID=A0A8K1CQA2_PYTOL|nr:hypothetical protein Poli38472_014067 [Pythium oligandrum]|eukprot:TMW66755.1 hypothetical protein Poli38472_014067 [Pythium oligandrum]
MVQFAKKLVAAQRPEWSGHYLEYKQLKKKLKAVQASSRDLLGPSTPGAAQDGFQRALDAQVERVVLFFLTKQGEFAKTLAALRREQDETTTADLEAMHALGDRFRRTGDELVQLLHYVELNATGIRKILKKHDKMMKERKIMGAYLSSRTDSQASHLQQLYHDEGISAIIATIRTALSELRALEAQVDASVSHRLTRTISEDEPVLSKIALARRRLRQSTQYVQTIAAKALIFDGESSEDEEDDSSAYVSFLRSRSRSSYASRFLNMSCTFLYMTNYYIVAPTSGDYAAALGAEAALSGVIVGMTPIASLLSAVLYSWWANRSYKSPLLFATVCLVIGNLLYGLALYYNSIAMAITGRLLNGFGGARAINRRYIADNYSREERTQASAQFVTASALGMAAGPALAAALDYAPDFSLLGVQVTVETAPGWVMFVFWLIYLLAIALFFEEPDRSIPLSDPRRSTYALENGEQMPLLTSRSRTVSTQPPPKLSSLWRNVPVVATLVIYIVLKAVLECLLTASSPVAQYYFQWNSTASGVYLAALGLLMFPTNLLVSWYCDRYDDRELILRSEVLMLLGVAVIIHYGTGAYESWQFIVGGIIIFISTNVLEGVNMSLLSKTIPKAFARGTFNSGLLATEAGTFGRALGDVLITLVGLPGIQYVLNWTFAPMLVISALTILYTLRVYSSLATTD